MVVGLCVVIVAALTWALTSSVARPVRHDGPVAAQPRPRDLDRWRAQLRLSADRITRADLESLLLAQGVSATDLARVTTAVGKGRASARTLWCFADRFGGERCLLAVDAEVAERSMKRHLEAGTIPDWRAMETFAALSADTSPAAMPHQEVLDLDSVPTFGDLSFPPDLDDWSTQDDDLPVDLSAFDDLPPISGPAHLGGAPPPPPPEPPTERRPRRRRRNDRGWPMAS
ncbi:hypothetical protein ABLE68_18500 [Nocardioides sp. CN2-186]|uniref:hypothetical protein n=1 Tax=Nocardioides tweenelious TaxID=3156607 RepID=UPI0032B477BF